LARFLISPFQTLPRLMAVHRSPIKSTGLLINDKPYRFYGGIWMTLYPEASVQQTDFVIK
jgi:hypothetical protein